ncbi:MAG: hypothetical protein AAGU10_08335 [Methanosarcina mazei]
MVYGYTENGIDEELEEMQNSIVRLNEVIKNITYEIQRVTFNIYVSESVEVTGLEHLNKSLKIAMVTRALLQQQVNNYKKQ